MTVAKDIPRHTHHRADEGVYVLDGVLEIEFDDRKHHAPKGTFALLPRGVAHALRRATSDPADLLARRLGALRRGSEGAPEDS
jgi:quercetin dioxygenase-like cupin family protein